MTTKTILVSGGAGYIGTHTVVELLEGGFKVVVVDNLDNASSISISRVREITGCNPEDLVLEEVDLIDFAATEKIFEKYSSTPFAACIHFAGLKAVGESVKLPLHYYMNNLSSTLNLLNLLEKYGCMNFVFSSSACVYGDPETVPIVETQPMQPTNPYGRTKQMVEEICGDTAKSKEGTWSIALLRYFNPIGAHPSGKIGEDPKGIPNNLVPYVSQVAVGIRPKLTIFGNDWDTPDGTGVRDYIHVVDLAKGHVAAVEKVISTPGMGAETYNLGTGNGVSVLEVVKGFEKACGKPIPYEFGPRRPGDIGTCYANAEKAKKELGWTAKLDFEKMCEDGWKWQSNNPHGYERKDPKQKRAGQIFALYGEE
uniref:UDP-glucose 4-epimerase n=1 Tax=Aplanochytrium stocchinoi TaxID=215587 RepID=A0A6S8B458_9STRA|mmetsp:Transcript_7472/g.9475  ORF Transcript_7472/g.9475 Transcript_7472/m.9475 type:complete len:368 (+) Transcript_7472:39-1142(+)|eukprot:CAMPEP_0204830364 /NCGR_PEP_ID=MMETSP1346-20131115/8490_1 /ASSEMBLY_ACC=CAM_ASM_000771 /TAXON_ID=215587 /ORGANISM="Aplanochytrium stocchinoi, Strain GSBS06" /LENGTH=367 /DNA_ID=CAMNT_0051960553 /DNA_START=70 /DNA_END=1173 /DNA_ORIENTATION=+